MKSVIKIGIYGINGHQIQHIIGKYPWTKLTATASIPRKALPTALLHDTSIRHYSSFKELLEDPNVDLVSICSPCRRDQAQEIIAALKAGKHVLAEKPCAMNESDLDAILTTSRKTGEIFHEMSWTAFEEPYYSMRKIILSEKLGEVVHVVAVKSYPYHKNRPQDEDVDGGLIEQCGVHAFRFIEHVACTPIRSLHAVETKLSNPIKNGGLHMATSIAVKLKNGGVASISANYLNPHGTNIWGYESLQIFGTKGMIESLQGGKVTRLVIGKKDFGSIPLSKTSLPGMLDSFCKQLSGGKNAWPLSIEDEISPTRWAIRAKKSAKCFAKS